MKRKSVRNMPVRKAKCATCPFGPKGDPRTRNSVEAQLLAGSHLCHHAQLDGKEPKHLCRGARDYQLEMLSRFGVLSEPTDEAYRLASEAHALSANDRAVR